MTGIFVRQFDSWSLVKAPFVGAEGVMRPCKAVYVNVDGMWHTVWRYSAEIISLPRLKAVEHKELHDVRTCAA